MVTYAELSQEYHPTYLNCSKSLYGIVSKLTCDYDIKFNTIQYKRMYFDIETYNYKDSNMVPLPDDPNSHIGIICCVCDDIITIFIN